MTPGKFIISPSPMMLGHCMASITSSGVSSWPVFSNPGADGAQDGIWTKTLMRCCIASSCIRRTPSRPMTLAISCGSVNMDVVPWGITARANCVVVSIPLSICMCASHRPGTMNRPFASITSVSGPIMALAFGPQYAKRPSAMAISVFGITSRECTLTHWPWRITISAGARPEATSIRRGATSAHDLIGVVMAKNGTRCRRCSSE